MSFKIVFANVIIGLTSANATKIVPSSTNRHRLHKTC